MLKKLFLFDLRAVARVMVPIYLGLLGYGVAARVSIWAFLHGDVPDLMRFFFLLVVAFFAILLFGSVVGSYLVLALRYRQSFFGDEGYLTHSLPVTPLQHLFSKLLCGLCVYLVTILFLFLSLLFLVGPDALPSVNPLDYLSGMGQSLLGSLLGTGQELISAFRPLDLILSLLSIAAGILSTYAAVTLGQAARRYWLLASVAIYIGISLSVSALSLFFTNIAFSLTQNSSLEEVLLASRLGRLAVSLLLGGASFWVCLRGLQRVELE